MAFDFTKAFNSFAETGTALNRGVNKMIGKDIFKDIKPIEESREFPPYGSFPEYDIPEPEQWFSKVGSDKSFKLSGSVITVPKNLDSCIQYRNEFKTAAKYYAERFAFKYQNCVQDFDTLIHYFSDMYFEGLKPMLERAYSLLLPFGVFSASYESFYSRQIETYQRAISSYEKMSGVELSKNQTAEQAGNMVGGAVRLRGGGFGLKGAAKGIAKAEAINFGMSALGKFVAQQSKMTQEEKATVFASFKQDVFFQEVYSDYYNTFFTMVQTLADNNELNGVRTIPDAEYNTMIQNLQNPMFPQDKMVSALVKLISIYPFAPVTFELLQHKFGHTEEVEQITNYFIG